MSRAGRELEELVARIEQVLSPLGAIVKSPDFLEDRITGQRREVDISIRGKMGSVEILIICECRDRSATQDVTWIEQIAQKALDVAASKAIAVSSSSFSEPALKKARFHSIETRLLHDLTPEAISGWFEAGDMVLTKFHSEIHHVSIDISQRTDKGDISHDVVEALHDPGRKLTASLFVRKSDGRVCNLSTIWAQVYENFQTSSRVTIPHDGSRIRRKIRANFSNENDRYQLPLTLGFVDVLLITFVVDLWTEQICVPVKDISSYGDSIRELLQTVQYRFDSDGKDHLIAIHRHPDGTISLGAEIRP